MAEGFDFNCTGLANQDINTFLPKSRKNICMLAAEGPPRRRLPEGLLGINSGWDLRVSSAFEGKVGRVPRVPHRKSRSSASLSTRYLVSPTVR